MGRPKVQVPDAGLDPREVVAGLARVKEAGWDLYEKSLKLCEYGGPQRAAMKDSIVTAAVALREVRGALQTEMSLLAPEQEGADGADVVGLVLIELQRNPAMLRAVLGQLQKSELKLLLERAGSDKVVVDATDGETLGPR